MDKFEQTAAASANLSSRDELTPEEKEEIYIRALGRARLKMSLYIHATVFGCVILILALINLLTSPGYPWVLWPFFGWGFGLFLHWFFSAKLMGIYENIKADEIARQLGDHVSR